MAETWNLPPSVAVAYAYVDARREQERGFRGDDYAALEKAAENWLSVASDLLEAGAFPRTTDEKDCSYCSFKPVCGPDAQDRAASALASVVGQPTAGWAGPLAKFAVFKSGEEE